MSYDGARSIAGGGGPVLDGLPVQVSFRGLFDNQ